MRASQTPPRSAERITYMSPERINAANRKERITYRPIPTPHGTNHKRMADDLQQRAVNDESGRIIDL